MTARADPDVAAAAVTRASAFPRLRYMGSKYRLVPLLAETFAEIGGTTALDAFAGSGVVAYTLKAMGYQVTANDFLTFPSIIAAATVENQRDVLSAAEIDTICGDPADDRDFIRSTFDGLYFDAGDRAFLDSAWSHIDQLGGAKRALAISALVLSAARKQPRGVFTVTDQRYDDGRRDLRLPMREHFRERAADYNAVVFDSGQPARAQCGDVAAVEGTFDLVYLDPPYAPPRDDNCYIKRYHFLEGLSVYWRNQTIMENTRTKKLVKRYTPFSYRATVTHALRETFERFWQVTQGNALYLRHLVEGEREAGHLERVAEVWRWSGDPVLRPQLVELVESSVGRLPDGVRRVGELLAFGEPLDVDMLARLAGPAELEDAEQRGLIAVRAGEVRLAHPLYAEVLRARTTTLRGRRLRGELVRALTAVDGPDVLRRATLSLDSDDPPDPVLLLQAGHLAANYFDLAMAERLARAARDAGGGIDASLLLGGMLGALGRSDEASTMFVEAAALATDDARRTHIAGVRATLAQFVMGRPDEVDDVLCRAGKEVSDPRLRDQLAALGVLFHAMHGRLDEAERDGRRVLETVDPTDQALALATLGLAAVLAARGRPDDAIELVPVGQAAAERAGLGYTTWLAFGYREITALRLAGRVHEAEAAARRHEAGVAAPVTALVAGFLTGQTALASGLVGSAARMLRDAIAALLNRDITDWLFVFRLSLVPAVAASGDIGAARAALEDARADYGPRVGFHEAEMVLAEAWVVAAEGAVSTAVALAHTAAGIARRKGQSAIEVVALHTAVCFGDGTVADRLAQLSDQVEGPRAPAATAHARALAADDGVALLAASDELERMGALLLAADAAAQAAAAHARQGRQGAVDTAAARAQRLAVACENARTPALCTVTRPLPLTGREREIVTLAAGGLTNREIADRLVISVRTIEGHLYRACAKLGAENRSQLAGILAGNG